MTKLAVTIIFVLAICALVFGAVFRSHLLIAVSCAASLTVIAVGVAAGGWRVLNPWSRS